MKTLEYDCVDTDMQAKMCYSLVCPKMQNNPAFDDIMLFAIKSVCSNDYNYPPKRIKVEVSEDKRKLVVSHYGKDEELLGGLMDNCVTYSRTTLELADDGNIHIIASNNKAFSLDEYESKYSGLRIYKDIMPFTSSEYPAVYRMHSMFHAFNEQGIEISYSEYKDLCPRKDTNFDDFEEESINHCPTEWKLYDYPSGIREGVQEHYPYRAYFCRYFGRYGIMCGHEKGHTKKGFTEVFSKYVCDDRCPNQLPEVTVNCDPFVRVVNGVEVIKPEDNYDIPGLDEETLEFRLNADFIRRVEKQLEAQDRPDSYCESVASRKLIENSVRSAKKGLLIGNEIPETIGIKNDNSPNPMRL